MISWRSFLVYMCFFFFEIFGFEFSGWGGCVSGVEIFVVDFICGDCGFGAGIGIC